MHSCAASSIHSFHCIAALHLSQFTFHSSCEGWLEPCAPETMLEHSGNEHVHDDATRWKMGGTGSLKPDYSFLHVGAAQETENGMGSSSSVPALHEPF